MLFGGGNKCYFFLRDERGKIEIIEASNIMRKGYHIHVNNRRLIASILKKNSKSTRLRTLLLSTDD